MLGGEARLLPPTTQRSATPFPARMGPVSDGPAARLLGRPSSSIVGAAPTPVVEGEELPPLLPPQLLTSTTQDQERSATPFPASDGPLARIGASPDEEELSPLLPPLLEVTRMERGVPFGGVLRVMNEEQRNWAERERERVHGRWSRPTRTQQVVGVEQAAGGALTTSEGGREQAAPTSGAGAAGELDPTTPRTTASREARRGTTEPRIVGRRMEDRAPAMWAQRTRTSSSTAAGSAGAPAPVEEDLVVVESSNEAAEQSRTSPPTTAVTAVAQLGRSRRTSIMFPSGAGASHVAV